MANAIKFCLKEAGLTIDELDAIVFYDKPLLKFERLLETYYAFSPRGLVSFIKAIKTWFGEKLFLKRQIHKELAVSRASYSIHLCICFQFAVL